MNLRTRFFLVATAAGGLALAGCSRSDTPVPAPAASPTAAATSGQRAIVLTADDAMKFSLTEIRAKPGESLRLTLKNIGAMPRQVMAHNWVLVKAMSDTDLNAFGMKASTLAPDYLPTDRSSVLANTKLIAGGESDTIEFTAPAIPGTYPFLCTYPGHFAIMKGKLIVN